jgi:opacity protein-like surface antigen
MRRLLVVLGLLASISGVRAQEFEIPTLRGTDSFVPDAPGPLYRPRWSGFYIGGQAGYGVAGTDFVTSTNDLVAHMLRNSQLESEQRLENWSVLGKNQTGSFTFGGFLGYNIGWESLILGARVQLQPQPFLLQFADVSDRAHRRGRQQYGRRHDQWQRLDEHHRRRHGSHACWL